MAQQVVYRTREMQRLEHVHGKSMDVLLRQLYVDQGLTVEQVGAVLGITKGAVSRWMERFDIPARRTGSKAVA